MFNLTDKNISYLIVTPCVGLDTITTTNLCERACSILYSKDYTVFQISEYFRGDYNKSFMAICNTNNDRLREDSITLMEEITYCKEIIVKYSGEDENKKIFLNGSERLLSVSIYENNSDKKIYLYNGISFSFTEKKRYRQLTDRSQLKPGMVVEFLNNDRWIEKEVGDISIEYDRLYKLLIKYDKLRVCID